ncbi:hypothetical protein GCM10007071_12170 [Marinobacter zhanjiangensis]|uniref:Uncharacterized protein n=1 Tax=Marinobacter zhanjiangensis TaxID=578215 RepID=A0ABQ3ASY2_9GAMM|nr:hypothetical protein GCM10007071_12170 [Marinobacter zhanjiangensis]
MTTISGITSLGNQWLRRTIQALPGKVEKKGPAGPLKDSVLVTQLVATA